MRPALNRIMIYARDMRRTAEFYQRFFGFESSGEIVGGLIELTAPEGGANLLVHQAAKSVKLGQAGVKLVFDVQDIEGFKKRSAELGLEFGATHEANGYSFANAKDPDKNSVSISSRAFRIPAQRTTDGFGDRNSHDVLPGKGYGVQGRIQDDPDLRV